MDYLRIVQESKNLEIISKLMNSVAKQYDCKVTYCEKENCLRFQGKPAYRKYITEETLSFFKVA